MLLGILFTAVIISEKYDFVTGDTIDFKHIIDEVNSGQNTWTAGENFNPSISRKSINKLLGAKFDQLFEGPFKTFNNNDSEPLPNQFDSRTKWPYCNSISHIRDQGYCGSCWAVAAAEVLTDRYCIATKGKFKTPLSMEDLLSCCHECGQGCNGGSPWYAWYHIWRLGIVSGGDYDSGEGCKTYSFKPCEHHMNGTRPPCESFGDLPTPKCNYRCSNRKYKRGFWPDHHRVLEFYRLNETEKIQREILENGPVEVAFVVYEDFLTYKSGVYKHVTGKKLGGHAVKLIGWGQYENTPYWLAVNSWNNDWGDNGYFKIYRGSNECKIESYAMAGTADVGYL